MHVVVVGVTFQFPPGSSDRPLRAALFRQLVQK